jgi:hypothetical protein
MMAQDLFTNYRDLIARVEDFSSQLVRAYGEQLGCRHGCNDCCQQDLHLLPVEFSFLLQGCRRLPAARRELIRNRVTGGTDPSGPCVLLHGAGCLFYHSRPIICRTHGLPLLITVDGQERRDCCPKNFVDRPLDQLPRRDLLHLDRLNTILIAVNLLFCSQTERDPGNRIPLSGISEFLNSEFRI